MTTDSANDAREALHKTGLARRAAAAALALLLLLCGCETVPLEDDPSNHNRIVSLPFESGTVDVKLRRDQPVSAACAKAGGTLRDGGDVCMRADGDWVRMP